MGKIAWVFAGQGAQKVGMGRALYEESMAARIAMDAAERLRPGTLALCFDGPEEALKETINTQPCLMMVDYACAVALEEAGARADMVAGFSLGEVAAAAYAGMMTFDEAFGLTMKRAELMQACAQAHPGAMGAVLRLTAQQVLDLCAEIGDCYPVNFNCPGQTVVACAEDKFAALTERAAKDRGRVMRLNVSGAFHSPWMQDASVGLRAYLDHVSLKAPNLPLYANATAQPYAGDMKALLAGQISSPVKWEETVRNMAGMGVTTFVEVGAGQTLSGLIKKTLDARVFHVEDIDSLHETLEGIKA